MAVQDSNSDPQELDRVARGVFPVRSAAVRIFYGQINGSRFDIAMAQLVLDVAQVDPPSEGMGGITMADPVDRHLPDLGQARPFFYSVEHTPSA